MKEISEVLEAAEQLEKELQESESEKEKMRLEFEAKMVEMQGQIDEANGENDRLINTLIKHTKDKSAAELSPLRGNETQQTVRSGVSPRKRIGQKSGPVGAM